MYNPCEYGDPYRQEEPETEQEYNELMASSGALITVCPLRLLEQHEEINLNELDEEIPF